MNHSFLKRMIAGIVVILFLLLYWYSLKTSETNIKQLSPSIYAKSSYGTSVFSAFLKEQFPQSQIAVNMRPLFHSEQLKEYDSLVILGPKREISELQAEKIADYVRAGGTLVLGIQEKNEKRAVKELLFQLNINRKLIDHQEFQNMSLAKASPDVDGEYFKADEQYEFYSKYWLESGNCLASFFRCFLWEEKYGKGEVIIMVGLPLISNSLVSKGDNWKFLERFASKHPKILIDEFFHFYSDATIKQLFQIPEFTVPFFSVLASILLFLLFGHTKFHEYSQRVVSIKKSLSYHRVSERFLLNIYDSQKMYPYILRKHLNFLKKIFPDHSQEIESKSDLAKGIQGKKDFLLRGKKLIDDHLEIERQKGRKI